LQQCYDNALAAKNLAAAYRQGKTTTVRLCVSNTINLTLLIPALTELARVFPGLEFTFARGCGEDLLEALKAGSVDLAVAGPIPDWNRLERWALFEEDYALIVNHSNPLGRFDAVSLKDLRTSRLLARPYDEHAKTLEAILQRAGLEQRRRAQVISDQDLLTLIEADLGLAIMPRSAATSANLLHISPDDFKLRRTVFLYGVAGRERSPAAVALMRLFRSLDWESMPALERAAFRSSRLGIPARRERGRAPSEGETRR
jgi:DNA-binding transcriptional LysR family regulator